MMKTDNSGVLVRKGAEKWSGCWREIKGDLIDRGTPNLKLAKAK